MCVSICDKGIDLGFVLGKKGVNMSLINEASTLSLGKDEVGKENETEVGVEREPESW